MCSGACEAQCPYCGEPVELSPDPVGLSVEEYIEDCPVCCRPWTVRVHRDEEKVQVELLRDDD